MELEKIVVLLQETDLSMSDIALRMHCSRSAINGVNNRFRVRVYEGRRSRWIVAATDEVAAR
jgi:predicted DNA-binding protein YlxM (UPF0122 family)